MTFSSGDTVVIYGALVGTIFLVQNIKEMSGRIIETYYHVRSGNLNFEVGEKDIDRFRCNWIKEGF